MNREGNLQVFGKICLVMGIMMCLIAFGNYIVTGSTSLDGLGHVSVDFTICMTVVCVMLYKIMTGLADVLKNQARQADELAEIKSMLETR